MGGSRDKRARTAHKFLARCQTARKRAVSFWRKPHTLHLRVKNLTLKVTVTLLLLFLTLQFFTQPKLIYGDSLGFKQKPPESLQKPLKTPKLNEQPLVTKIVPKPPPKPPAPVVNYGSGCAWLKGELLKYIPASAVPAAINIASRESGCNPQAVNRSSGACNVFQELPCGKWGGRNDLAAHIRGANAYANQRYGGWWGAWSAWQSKHWW